MFLYLSKLLPLFLYPLGLSCLLLLVALRLLWKKSRWTAVPIVLALLILIVSSNTWFSNAMVQSLELANIPTTELPSADAIVILGGSTHPFGSPRPWLEITEEGDRVLYGAKLYRDGKAPRVILSGGRISWRGGGPPESADMAELVKTMGVPESAILQDPTSMNTYENAVNVKKILEAQGLRRVLLVTSAMHMPRSLAIFRRLGIDAVAAPTDYLVNDRDLQERQGSLQAILLNALPQSERLQQTTRALKEYIGIGIYWLRGWL